ncbi:MAG TPA: fused response regulator/phosphatase [Actinospica sp.]|nr:fused response regulator/phosphatase [Actinospica sp.]
MYDRVMAGSATAGPPPPAEEDAALAVLVAEDDPADALLTMELLAESVTATKVVCVATAREAVEATAAGRVDCLVLDLHLPDLDGIGALDTWLPSLGATAVVVMTGLDDRAAGLAAVRAGAQDYLVKGRVDPELLDRAIRYAVQRKRAEQSAADLLAARWHAAENERLERGLLPTPLLRGAPVRVTTRCLPHRDGALLGGDYFDVVETEDGVVHAVVGDVSGHGPDEAALGAALRVAWRTLVLAGASGPSLLASLERVLDAERGEQETYTTLAAIDWRPGEPAARLIRAGHPGALTRLHGEVTLQTGEHGPALGIAPGGAWWPVVPLPVPPGGEILLYTDGLYENRDEHGAIIGQDRMMRSAKALAHLSDDRFVDALIAATRDRTGHGDRDDVAVLLLRHVTQDGQGPQARKAACR